MSRGPTAEADVSDELCVRTDATLRAVTINRPHVHNNVDPAQRRKPLDVGHEGIR
jgi:hypothetical protein